jgi:hypothetical protein
VLLLFIIVGLRIWSEDRQHFNILLNNKIYIPKVLRKEILKWYNTTLHHPGIVRTEKSIKFHSTWPGMRTDIEKYMKKCRICQLCKNPHKLYGYSYKQDINQGPWHTICVNTIGPYSVTKKHDMELNLLAITICDPATGWFDVTEIEDKTAAETAKIFDQIWFVVILDLYVA